jgi:hypothetical protein
MGERAAGRSQGQLCAARTVGIFVDIWRERVFGGYRQVGGSSPHLVPADERPFVRHRTSCVYYIPNTGRRQACLEQADGHIPLLAIPYPENATPFAGIRILRGSFSALDGALAP